LVALEDLVMLLASGLETATGYPTAAVFPAELLAATTVIALGGERGRGAPGEERHRERGQAPNGQFHVSSLHPWANDWD